MSGPPPLSPGIGPSQSCTNDHERKADHAIRSRSTRIAHPARRPSGARRRPGEGQGVAGATRRHPLVHRGGRPVLRGTHRGRQQRRQAAPRRTRPNGLRTLKGAELQAFEMANLAISDDRQPRSYPQGRAHLRLFTRRAVLNIAMLLRDSEVARCVRTYLLDTEEATRTVIASDPRYDGLDLRVTHLESSMAQIGPALKELGPVLAGCRCGWSRWTTGWRRWTTAWRRWTAGWSCGPPCRIRGPAARRHQPRRRRHERAAHGPHRGRRRHPAALLPRPPHPRRKRRR